MGALITRCCESFTPDLRNGFRDVYANYNGGACRVDHEAGDTPNYCSRKFTRFGPEFVGFASSEVTGTYLCVRAFRRSRTGP